MLPRRCVDREAPRFFAIVGDGKKLILCSEEPTIRVEPAHCRRGYDKKIDKRIAVSLYFPPQADNAISPTSDCRRVDRLPTNPREQAPPKTFDRVLLCESVIRRACSMSEL